MGWESNVLYPESNIAKIADKTPIIRQSDVNSRVNRIINLDEIDNKFYDDLRNAFDNHVIGQSEAKEKLASVISNALLRIRWHKWPLGTLFFHGPTWVWKTEMVRALSQVLFWSDNWFIKVQMEQFTESHTKSRFIWAPPSYIWYDDEPIFSAKNFYLAYDIAKKNNKLNPIISRLWPVNIILFDEVEKAHSEVIQSLLGLLDDWRLSLANPKKPALNFANSIVIFTSNIWQAELSEFNSQNKIWFWAQKTQKDKTKILEKSLKDKFSPEFLWRIDDDSFIEFKKLENSELKEIISLQVSLLEETINSYYQLYPDVEITLSQEIYDHIISEWYNDEKWARDLVRWYINLFEKKVDLLINSYYFDNLENVNWKVFLNFFMKDWILFVDFTLDTNQELKVKVEKSFNENDWRLMTLVKQWQLVELGDIVKKLWYADVSNVTTYVRWESLLIINRAWTLNRYKELDELVEIAWWDYTWISLNWDNLWLMWLKSTHVTRLINDILLKTNFWNNWENDLRIFLLAEIYWLLYKISERTLWVDRSNLVNEILPIIDKRLRELKKIIS